MKIENLKEANRLLTEIEIREQWLDKLKVKPSSILYKYQGDNKEIPLSSSALESLDNDIYNYIVDDMREMRKKLQYLLDEN